MTEISFYDIFLLDYKCLIFESKQTIIIQQSLAKQIIPVVIWPGSVDLGITDRISTCTVSLEQPEHKVYLALSTAGQNFRLSLVTNTKTIIRAEAHSTAGLWLLLPIFRNDLKPQRVIFIPAITEKCLKVIVRTLDRCYASGSHWYIPSLLIIMHL